MKSKHFSLEERVVEPFHSIRWIFISKTRAFLAILALVLFDYSWWHFNHSIFNFWRDALLCFINLIQAPWTIETGFWPDTSHPLLNLPKLNAAVLAPTPSIWWAFALGTVCLWIITGFFKPVLLPIRTFTRFMLFLIAISLACFAISPMQFHHTIEEWSKIFFLSSYASIFIYSAIWTLSVLWFPISLPVKLTVSALLVAYQFVGPPILFFISVMVLQHSSLVLLPLFALAVGPLVQLGWFVSFYSLALSSGKDGMAEEDAA